MKAYELALGAGIDGLRQVDRPTVPLRANEVRVRIEAAALNYRDMMFAEGRYYGMPGGRAVIPLGDGAGKVVEVGQAVTRVQPGDRVIASFWPHWIDGEMAPEKLKGSLGAALDGTLAEELVIGEQALVIAPRGLAGIEAAALPCAGVTAWNALFGAGRPTPGATVVILGTGGVSIWALQLASAAGLRTVITSSTDEKLERAVQLGAAETINYRTTPEWQNEVLRLTDGRGADLVVEVGGTGTISRSIKAARFGGTIVVVGGVAGNDGGGVDPETLVHGAKCLRGIMVGSRAMLEDLVRFVETAGIRPVVGQRFGFDDAAAAYRSMHSSSHFGKVAIDVSLT